MNKYTINGVELAYDPFDVDSMELLEREEARVNAECKAEKKGETAVARIRRICTAVLDFFDEVVGPGTAQALFGDRINARDILLGFREFDRLVGEDLTEFTRASLAQSGPRAQRRAANQK